MAQGDLLLFPSSGDLEDRLIAYWTRGPYVHCEVDMGDGSSIGAVVPRVERHPLPNGATVRPTGVLCGPRLLPAALAWLVAQVGDPYDAYDLGDAAGLAGVIDHLPLHEALHSYDCSALCLTFLIRAGYPVPKRMRTDPGVCSPNDLWRMTGAK